VLHGAVLCFAVLCFAGVWCGVVWCGVQHSAAGMRGSGGRQVTRALGDGKSLTYGGGVQLVDHTAPPRTVRRGHYSGVS